MLKRDAYILSGLAGIVVVAAALGLGAASRSGADGPPSSTPVVQPGFVGETPPAGFTPIPLPQVRAALVDPKVLIGRVEAQGTGNGIALGTSHAELYTAGELPNLRGRYVDTYPIWVVTVHGHFVPWSEPPGAHVSPLTKDLMFFDAYTGAALGDVYSTDTFTPRSPGAGIVVTPDSVDATESAQGAAAAP